MANRRKVERGINFVLTEFESDLVAQALDNYRDGQSDKDPSKPMVGRMVEFFDARSPDREYDIHES